MIDTSCTLGRNNGNTFRQTYGKSMVLGVLIKGPLAGAKFPPENSVAIPIGRHELYAPGREHPESSGTITVVHRRRTLLR